MLLENGGALLQLSSTDQLTHLPVNRDERSGIVVTSVHQHHADTQFAKHVFINESNRLLPWKRISKP